MNDYPVRVGSMLYTLVDPNRGHEVAYNRWYERDHFYAGCLVGPWLFAGRRWVATRRLKNLRLPPDSPVAVPFDAGSYLATYWVHEGKHAEHFDWAIDQVWDLYQNDRGFPERTHVHTSLFDGPWSVYRDQEPVPIELALDHHYAGLGNVFIDRTGDVGADELVGFLRDEAMPELLAESPIASGVSWSPISREGDVTDAAPMDLGSAPGGDERLMQLFFCEVDPEQCWDRFRSYAASVDASGLGTVRLAAAFIPTDVGTDTYTDELW